MLEVCKCFERKCTHFRGSKDDGSEATERYYCIAFPNKIPNDIAFGSNLHERPVKGDNGIQYEKHVGKYDIRLLKLEDVK